MSVVGPSGVDCVEPAGATYSTGPQAVLVQSQAPLLGPGAGSHWVETPLGDGFRRCTAVIGVDPSDGTDDQPLYGLGTATRT